MRLRKLKPSNTDLRELRIVLLALGRKAAHKQAHGLDGRSRLVYLKTVHEAYGHHLIIAPVMMNLAPQHQVPASAPPLKTKTWKTNKKRNGPRAKEGVLHISVKDDPASIRVDALKDDPWHKEFVAHAGQNRQSACGPAVQESTDPKAFLGRNARPIRQGIHLWPVSTSTFALMHFGPLSLVGLPALSFLRPLPCYCGRIVRGHHTRLEFLRVKRRRNGPWILYPCLG